MQKLLFFCLFSLYFIGAINAQEFENEIKQSFGEKPKIDFRLDSRNSFISSSSVRIFGIKLGLQYGNKISLGLGYNKLISEIVNSSIKYNGGVFKGKLHYSYISPYVEYIFYEDNKWELSIPVQFGFGTSFYINKENIGPKEFYFKRVLSYEPAITFQYRLLKYFGLGMGVGYRLMIIPNKEIEERFTSPVYLFKIKVYFQDIFNDL